MFIKLFGLVTATALVASSASAAVVTQNATVTHSGAPDYFVDYLDFAGFKSSLGILNSVTIMGNVSIQETLTYQNTVETQPVNLQFDLGVNNQPFITKKIYSFTPVTYSADGKSLTVSAGASLTYIASAAFVNSDLSNGFAGTIDGFVSSPGGPLYANGTVNAQAIATYDYTPVGVPEPSSLALLGLVGMVPFLRRRSNC